MTSLAYHSLQHSRGSVPVKTSSSRPCADLYGSGLQPEAVGVFNSDETRSYWWTTILVTNQHSTLFT